MEVVERDAVALWWYTRARRPALMIDSRADPYLDHMRDAQAGLGRSLAIIDIATDLAIPCFAAVSADSQGRRVCFGFGAHSDANRAVTKAVLEHNQMCSGLYQTNGTVGRPALARWWEVVTVSAEPWLAPAPGSRPVSLDAYRGSFPETGWQTAAAVLARHGMEVFVLDQTRVQTGLPAVKVFVPGLRPPWPRFAPGRLFDVPFRLGWVARRLRAEESTRGPSSSDRLVNLARHVSLVDRSRMTLDRRDGDVLVEGAGASVRRPALASAGGGRAWRVAGRAHLRFGHCASDLD